MPGRPRGRARCSPCIASTRGLGRSGIARCRLPTSSAGRSASGGSVQRRRSRSRPSLPAAGQQGANRAARSRHADRTGAEVVQRTCPGKDQNVEAAGMAQNLAQAPPALRDSRQHFVQRLERRAGGTRRVDGDATHAKNGRGCLPALPRCRSVARPAKHAGATRPWPAAKPSSPELPQPDSSNSQIVKGLFCMSPVLALDELRHAEGDRQLWIGPELAPAP